MKTTSFRTAVLGTPWRNLTYVYVETDEGLTGVGEARVLGKTHTVGEYLKDVQRHFIGHDPFNIEALYRRMTLLDFGKPGEVVYTGLALVELAYWDIIGKACGQPVYRLLGGQARGPVPAYANGWYTVERSPEQFAEAARRVMERGYRAMKFDPFGNGDLELERPEFYKSLDLIEAVASVTGTTAQIMLEMHGRFAPHQAREVARMVERYNVGWIEEPVRPSDIPALKSVRQHTSLPIATGERLYGAPEFRELWASGSVDIIQPDITQSGGILETKEDRIDRGDLLHHDGAPQRGRHNLHDGRSPPHVDAEKRQDTGALQRLRRPIRQAGGIELPRGGRRVLPGPGWARLGVELDEHFIRSNPPESVNGVAADPGLNMFENADWARRGQDL